MNCAPAQSQATSKPTEWPKPRRGEARPQTRVAGRRSRRRASPKRVSTPPDGGGRTGHAQCGASHISTRSSPKGSDAAARQGGSRLGRDYRGVDGGWVNFLCGAASSKQAQQRGQSPGCRRRSRRKPVNLQGRSASSARFCKEAKPGFAGRSPAKLLRASPSRSPSKTLANLQQESKQVNLIYRYILI